MSETVVGILGFICIIAIVFTLFKSLTMSLDKFQNTIHLHILHMKIVG